VWWDGGFETIHKRNFFKRTKKIAETDIISRVERFFPGTTHQNGKK
jgi:hypothetical protein